MLINCIYKYCTLLHRCNWLLLKVAYGFKVSYWSGWKVICQFKFCYSFREKQSLMVGVLQTKLLFHKLLSWKFVFKIFEKYLGRSSILLKLHVCNVEFYKKLTSLISIFQLLLVQVQAFILWKTFWWQLLSMIPDEKLKCFGKKNIF